MKKIYLLVFSFLIFSVLFSRSDPPDTGPSYFYVDVDVVGGDEDGSSWQNAFTTIQEGINAASSGDVIYVAAGTYNVGSTQTDGYNSLSRVYIDVAVSVQGVDGAAATIIQGAQASGGGHGADAVRCVYISTGTLQGFTITGGYTQSTGNAYYDMSGGGILQEGGTVQYCIINDNSAYNHGGGLFQYGSGISQSNLIYENSTTVGNGGGVYQYTGGELENCTVADNTASGAGGGIYLNSGGDVYNSIAWGNTGDLPNDDIYILTSGNVQYTCASNGVTNGVNGCTTSDPDFDDASNDDYQIFIDSPCYNTGDNNLSDAAYDLDGNDRILFTTIDMGAYETQGVSVTFTDGSAFNNNLSPSTTDQPFGRFILTGDVSGATLTSASIKLEGTRSGLSNIKLWSSSDATFNSSTDSTIGNTVFFDPGTSPAEFSGFSSAIKTTGTYYFITANTGSTISGSIQGVILETADLSVFSGTINSTISSAALSGSEVPCPVTLTSFTADAVQGKVELQWTTASEAENDHFLIIRDGDVIASIPGHGTCTEPHDYVYTDATVQPGVHEYVLADVTWGGEVTEHAPVNVEVENGESSVEDFVLNKAYPNPFNPSVTINYQLSTINRVSASIYNTNGDMIKSILNEEMNAGSHTLTWNAKGMPSGVYILKMVAGNVMQSQKLVLMK